MWMFNMAITISVVIGGLVYCLYMVSTCKEGD